MEPVTCPHCTMLVVPTSDALCPACRRNIHAPPDPATRPAPPPDAWKSYQETLRDPVPPPAPSAEAAPATEVAVPAEPEPTVGKRSASADAAEVLRFRKAVAAFTPRAWVTPALIAVNVLVFAGLLIAARGWQLTPDQLLAWGANYGPRTLRGEWWRLVTAAFLHFNLLHLGFNMLLLADLGRLMERLLGNVGYLTLYLVSAVVASLASLWWRPTIVSAGASGAGFGLCGALLAFLVLQRGTVPGAVVKHLRSVLVFVGFNLIFGMTVTWIDNAAHVGGFAAGFGLGLLLARPLSPELVRGRPARNLAAAVAGIVAVVLGALALPPAPADISAEMQHFSETEQRLLTAYNDLMRRAKSGGVSDDESSAALETQIIEPWVALRRRIEPLQTAPHANQPLMRKIVECMRLREESWQALLGSVREARPELIQQHRDRWEAANRCAQDVQKLAQQATPRP
jgi:rhomboid protease GluP